MRALDAVVAQKEINASHRHRIGKVGVTHPDGHFEHIGTITVDDRPERVCLYGYATSRAIELDKAVEITAANLASNGTPWYENEYTCPACSHEWVDESDSRSNDACPNCGERDVSPDGSREVLL